MIDVRQYWTEALAQDAALGRWFAPGAVIEWPCTGERFSVASFVRVNCAYPGAWEGEVERVVEQERCIITVTRVCARDGSLSCRAVSFFELSEDGRIAALTEYWADDGPPPEWRQTIEI